MGRYGKQKAAKSAIPKGWTEQQWKDEQYSWVTDPLGPWLWATFHDLKTETGQSMEWLDRGFLVDILCDMHPLIVVGKPTQIGLTTIMIDKIHFVAKVLGWRVIYTLPTHKLLEEMDKTKIRPILMNNPAITPTGDFTLTVHTYTEPGAGYVVQRGTAGDSQDIALTADLIVADEVDRSDVQVIEGLESRMMASKIMAQWWFSNPARPDQGADKKWQLSDKREWHVICPYCGLEQFLTWWDNIATRQIPDESDEAEPDALKDDHYYCCRACQGEFSDDDRRKGYWKATDKGDWHGYHISHLIAPWMSANKLKQLERDKTKEQFYNFYLGLPVIGEGISVERSLIMQSVVTEDDEEKFKLRNGKLKFLGVDVGKSLHCVVGNETGIIKLACLADDSDCTKSDRDNLDSTKSKWGKLVQLMRSESVNLCVIDNGPVEKQADFQRKFPYKVLRCVYDYNEKRKDDWEKSKDGSVVNVHRTRVIDSVISAYGKGELPIFLPRHSPWESWLDVQGKKSGGNCLTHHWESFYVVGADGSDENIVKKDRMGNVIRTWENAGPDHFGHANVYFYLAKVVGYRGGSGGSFAVGDFTKPKKSETDADDFDDLAKEDEVSFYS